MAGKLGVLFTFLWIGMRVEKQRTVFGNMVMTKIENIKVYPTKREYKQANYD